MVFRIPTVSHNTELTLRQGNETYLRDGTPLTSPNVKHDIMRGDSEMSYLLAHLQVKDWTHCGQNQLPGS